MYNVEHPPCNWEAFEVIVFSVLWDKTGVLVADLWGIRVL